MKTVFCDTLVKKCIREEEEKLRDINCENWPLLVYKNIPSYVQIYDIIFQLIQDGELQEGDYLPGENYLAAHWRVSRSTVRMAVRKLEEDGYLYKMQGKRTTVATRTSHFDNSLQWLFNPCIKNCILPITSMNVKSELQQGGQYVAEQMGYQNASCVLVSVEAEYFSNERKVATTLLMFHNKMLEEWNLSLRNTESVKELLSQKIYQNAIRSRIELSAIGTEEEIGGVLDGCNEIIAEEVLIGVNNEPLAYCKHRMDGDWYRFAVDRKVPPSERQDIGKDDTMCDIREQK